MVHHANGEALASCFASAMTCFIPVASGNIRCYNTGTKLQSDIPAGDMFGRLPFGDERTGSAVPAHLGLVTMTRAPVSGCICVRAYRAERSRVP